MKKTILKRGIAFLFVAVFALSSCQKNESGSTFEPSETISSSAVTSEPPSTIEAPSTTTSSSSTATEEPPITTERPAVTTEQPIVTTEQPTITTEQITDMIEPTITFPNKEYTMPDFQNAKESVSVDFSKPLGERTNLVGFLHAWNAYKPGDALIDALNPAIHREAIHLAVEQYERAQKLSSKPELILLISTSYAEARYNYGHFPGKDISWDEYKNFVREMYTKAVNGGVDMSKVIIDVWNEPYATWYPYGSDIAKNRASFLELWKITYDVIKELNPNQRIMGPGFGTTPPEEIHGSIDGDVFGFLEEWLDFCIENNCIPEYLSWHMNSVQTTPTDEINQMKAIFAERNVEFPPLIIDEVIFNGHQSPGVAAWYLAQMQRNDVAYAGHAVWVRNELDQLIFVGDNGRWAKTGEYHMYETYASMKGTLLSSTNSELLDLIAVRTETETVVLLGNKGSFLGTTGITLENIDYGSYNVKLYRIPYKNGGAVTEEDITLLWDADYRNIGKAELALDWKTPQNGYYLVITPITE